jgi:biopolymer transport protein ExbD
MNLWNIRHQGSPQSVEGLTADEVLDGVKEGIWDPSDEVMGPDDSGWVPLEKHPVFEQAMADYDPPPPPPHPDETKLDMNPLIDVALVLLIFFMLTTTYEELRKEFDPPTANKEQKQGPKTEAELKQTSIRVTARMEDGRPVYRVENEVVREEDLEAKFKDYRDRSGHEYLAMEVEAEVPWKAVVAIQDAAAGAKFREIIRVVRPGR